MQCSTSLTLYFAFSTSLALEWEPLCRAIIEQSHPHVQEESLSWRGTGSCLVVRKPLLLPWQGLGWQRSPKMQSTWLCQERVDRKNVNSPNRKYTLCALTMTGLQYCGAKKKRGIDREMGEGQAAPPAISQVKAAVELICYKQWKPACKSGVASH